MGNTVRKPVIDVTGVNLHFNEASTSLSYYLKDIRKSEVLSFEKEKALFERIRNGDKSAEKEIIESNQRFVLAVAKRFFTGNNIMDLVQEGNLGMLKAIKEYNPDRKGENGEPIRFLSFASWYIRREISFYLVNSCPLVRKTNNVKTIFKINKIKNTFFLKNGRQPTNEEVCEIMESEHNMKINDLSYLYDVETKLLSNNYNEENTRETLENSQVFNEKSASLNGYVDKAEREYNMAITKTFLSKLTPRERTIVECLYGLGINLDRPYTMDEVAKELGLTKERVRQIKNSSVNKMRKYSKMIAV